MRTAHAAKATMDETVAPCQSTRLQRGKRGVRRNGSRVGARPLLKGKAPRPPAVDQPRASTAPLPPVWPTLECAHRARVAGQPTLLLRDGLAQRFAPPALASASHALTPARVCSHPPFPTFSPECVCHACICLAEHELHAVVGEAAHAHLGHSRKGAHCFHGSRRGSHSRRTATGRSSARARGARPVASRESGGLQGRTVARPVWPPVDSFLPPARSARQTAAPSSEPPSRRAAEPPSRRAAGPPTSTPISKHWQTAGHWQTGQACARATRRLPGSALLVD